MQGGGIILSFGLLFIGRGLLDVFRSTAVAEANRRRNAHIRSGRSRISFASANYYAEDAAGVRIQGKRVLWFGGIVTAVGMAVLIFAGLA